MSVCLSTAALLLLLPYSRFQGTSPGAHVAGPGHCNNSDPGLGFQLLNHQPPKLWMLCLDFFSNLLSVQSLRDRYLYQSLSQAHGTFDWCPIGVMEQNPTAEVLDVLGQPQISSVPEEHDTGSHNLAPPHHSHLPYANASLRPTARLSPTLGPVLTSIVSSPGSGKPSSQVLQAPQRRLPLPKSPTAPPGPAAVLTATLPHGLCPALPPTSSHLLLLKYLQLA